MKTVIGVDPSSRSMHAVATSDFDAPNYKAGQPLLFKQALHKTDKPIACAETYMWMRDVVDQTIGLGDAYVFIEIPVMGRAGAHTMMVIAQVVGAAAAAAQHSGAKVVFVNNGTWKKVSVGKGNSGKPEIKAWCKVAWPEVYEAADGNQDLMDAAGINRYGQHVVGMSVKKVTPKRVVRRKKR